MKADHRIRELEELVVRLIAERDAAIERQRELELRNLELEEQNQQLAKRLSYHENAHTPPSKRPLKKRERPTGEGKKRGAPKGHRGATRTVPPPEEVVDVSAAQCPECHQHPGDPVAVETHVIEDILPPREVTVKVTRYDLHTYKCQHCGREFSTRHERCPRVGHVGPSLTVYTTMLKYHLRGPIRKVQAFLAQYSGFDISPKGVHDILLRVAEACRGEYERLLERVRAARWVHIDETHFDVLGKRHWLWIFRTDGNDVLAVIRPSRGRKVLEEILGEDFEGPAIVDGWKAYWYIRILQRCWSHLMREVDDFKDASDAGRRLSEEVHARFDELKELLASDPPMEVRERRKDELDAGMASLVERYTAFKELEKPVTYLRNGLGHWYTCLLYPGMEPTNNLGEQAMREHVIMRNIIGCFRSVNGSQAYQYIASLLATWKLQGKNMFEELERLVVREICLR